MWGRVLAGDSRAFGLIWDRHRGRVFGHLLLATGDGGEAEELTGVTFLELWKRRRGVRFVDDSLLPWLLVTARNVARNAVRAKRRYRALLDKLPPPEVAPDPADAVEARLDPRVRAARETLAAARPVDRDLVALTTIEGLTVADAADVLHLSEAAARMRLSRLRHRLNAPAPHSAEGSTS